MLEVRATGPAPTSAQLHAAQYHQPLFLKILTRMRWYNYAARPIFKIVTPEVHVPEVAAK